MATATAPQQLTAGQAKAIAKAQARYDRAKAAADNAEAENKKTRAKYRDLVPAGETIAVGGYEITRTPSSSGERFDLTGYREEHELTDEMRAHVKPGSPYDRWNVKPDAERKALGLGL